MQNNRLKTLIHTDEFGKYLFMLENGEYEVHIGSDKQSVDIFHVMFTDDSGFFTQHKNHVHLHEVTEDELKEIETSNDNTYNRYFKDDFEDKYINVKHPRFAKNITNTHRW